MMKPIYMLGDFHGRFEDVKKIIINNDIRDSIIISVGDVGIGFLHESNQIRLCERMNQWFENRNINFLAIRGNHDDPSYFLSSERIVKMSNFELLEDYTLREINGQKFLFVGGAISIDRYHRKEGVNYWSREPLILDKEKVVQCDVLVTHTAPTWCGPLSKDGIYQFVGKESRDPALFDECIAERRAVDYLITESKAKMHYCGHFHLYSWVEFKDCYSTILDINQFKEHRMI